MPNDKNMPDDAKAAPGLKDFKKDPVKPSDKPAAKSPARPDAKAKSKPAPKLKKAKSGVSFPAAFIMSVIAASAGAAGGWMLPKVFDPANAAPAQAITKNAQAIKTANQNISGLSQTAQTLQSGLSSVTSEVQSRAGQSADIDALNQAVTQLQSVDIAADRAAAMEPMMARVDALETLITPEGEDTGVASQLLERLTALETRLEDLQAAPPVSMEPVVLSYSTPDTDPAPAENIAADTGEDYDLVANFPRAAMLQALSVQSQNTQEPSWLRKILSKHVQTGDVSTASARDAINDAQSLVVSGDIAGAVTVIEGLNPTLRAAAHTWMIEAKAALK